MTDDGLDIGICRIDHHKRQLSFAGAKICLYINRESQITVLKGDGKSVGYRRSARNLEFSRQNWQIKHGDKFYLTTDGYVDQNGGDKDYPLGRKRLLQIISGQSRQAMSLQGKAFAEALRDYMGIEAQRDDITVVGFSLDKRVGAYDNEK